MSDIYWLNKNSRTFLGRGYLLPGVTPEARIREIAEYAEKILGIKGYADRFESYMHKGWFSLASPVWSNFGSGRGLPISCNGSYIPDDTGKIFDKLSEVGMMTKYGAGTSAYFGDVRPRGSPIRDGSKSDGPFGFMRLYDLVASVISQGGVRRGSFAAYLPVEHPDILEFLTVGDKGNVIQDMFIGVTVTDAWMEKMEAGDKAARKVWSKIIEKRSTTPGYPYIVFIDTVNRAAPQVYKDKGMRIYASNLCVTGDTLIDIVSDDADPIMLRIKDLGHYMAIHTGVKVKSFDEITGKTVYSTISAFAQTGVSTELIEIEDESGRVLRCTPDHQVYTQNRGYVAAGDLLETDTLQLAA